MKLSQWIFGLYVLAQSFCLTAEPYLAVRSGLKCTSCHVSPTGGGMRTDFGQIYGHGLSGQAESAPDINTRLTRNLQLGGDFRASYRSIRTDQQADQNFFQTDRATIYLNAQLLPGRLSFYIDQQLAPASDNRTAWLMLKSENQQHYLRAGQFFLPFGLRLEDDSAFIRQVSGINFATADNGIELGYEQGAWSTQLAISNGTAGAVEVDSNKQLSGRIVYVRPGWRLGGSFNINKSVSAKREMFNLFTGFNALGSQWLFEIDQIIDTTINEITQQVVFAEVNHEVIAGHNLKLTLESHDPNTDVDVDQRVRNSLVWEYFPMPLVQLRSGLRFTQGIPQKPLDNNDELFVNLHSWF